MRAFDLAEGSPEMLAGIRGLFDPDTPNHPMLASLLGGRSPGVVITHGDGEPGEALAILDYHRVAFASRGASRAFLAGAMAGRDEALLVTMGPAPGDRADQPGECIPRVELSRPVRPGPARVLPSGCAVRPMDAARVEACAWRHEVVAACGSVDGFLRRGFGVVVLDDAAIAAEAYACFVAAGRAELGVTTRLAHRGRGLATVACAALLDACAGRGLSASWSCNADHVASIALAGALGFGAERKYAFALLRGGS